MHSLHVGNRRVIPIHQTLNPTDTKQAAVNTNMHIIMHMTQSMKAKKKLAKLYVLLYYSKAIFFALGKRQVAKKGYPTHGDTWYKTSKKLNFIADFKCNPIQSMLYIQCHELVIAVTTCF